MKLLLLKIFFFTSVIISYAQEQNHFTYYDTLRGADSKFRSCYDVTYYDLHLTIVPDQEYIEGFNAIHYQSVRDFDTLQLDLFNNYIIDSLTWNDEQIRYRTDSNTIYVIFDQGKQVVGSSGVVKVYYSGFPNIAKNAPWDGGLVWSKDSVGNTWSSVACEGTGASLWWPCKDYLGDEPDSMSIHFTVPVQYDCISNGSLRGVDLEEDYATFNWHVSYPINNYNVTFYLGKYSEVKSSFLSSDGSEVPLSFYPLTCNKNGGSTYFEGQVLPMLKAYEHYFGRYPFAKDGYKIVEAPYWGMEHQSAIAYGNDYLLNDYGFDFIIIHESAHEYWGNAVSVKDHGEMWIHEAFATYMESLYLEYRDSLPIAEAYLQEQKLRIKNKQPILGPLHVNYDGWPDADMYYKGSWMLHTLRNSIDNDEQWFSIIKGLYAKYQGTFVTTNNVISFIDEKIDFNVKPFFVKYLSDTTYPVLEYNFEKITKKKSIIKYRWTNVPPDFVLPVNFILSNGAVFRNLVTTNWKSQEFKRITSIEVPEEKLLIKVSPTYTE